MLKDITLGQYFPADTFIHNLDPRTKIVADVIFIVELFIAISWISYLVVFLYIVLTMILGHIKPRAILKGLKPLVYIIILTAVLNVFFTTGDILYQVWIIKITRQGIQNAALMTVRVLLLVAGTFLLTYTTSPLSITDGLERLMAPLKLIKVPVYELSLMMSIALRFIPTLIEETDRIMSAQKSRGADFETGNLINRAKALLPLLIPLFVSAFRRADELATAMECRCYNGGEGRTRLKELHFKNTDWIALSFVLLLLVAVIILKVYGL